MAMNGERFKSDFVLILSFHVVVLKCSNLNKSRNTINLIYIFFNPQDKWHRGHFLFPIKSLTRSNTKCNFMCCTYYTDKSLFIHFLRKWKWFPSTVLVNDCIKLVLLQTRSENAITLYHMDIYSKQIYAVISYHSEEIFFLTLFCIKKGSFFLLYSPPPCYVQVSLIRTMLIPFREKARIDNGPVPCLWVSFLVRLPLCNSHNGHDETFLPLNGETFKRDEDETIVNLINKGRWKVRRSTIMFNFCANFRKSPLHAETRFIKEPQFK